MFSESLLSPLQSSESSWPSSTPAAFRDMREDETTSGSCSLRISLASVGVTFGITWGWTVDEIRLLPGSAVLGVGSSQERGGEPSQHGGLLRAVARGRLATRVASFDVVRNLAGSALNLSGTRALPSGDGPCRSGDELRPLSVMGIADTYASALPLDKMLPALGHLRKPAMAYTSALHVDKLLPALGLRLSLRPGRDECPRLCAAEAPTAGGGAPIDHGLTIAASGLPCTSTDAAAGALRAKGRVMLPGLETART